MARPTCLRLFEQLMRAAASRTFCTAGSNRPIRIAMIAITTSNSISVNPDRLFAHGDMVPSTGMGEKERAGATDTVAPSFKGVLRTRRDVRESVATRSPRVDNRLGE